MIDRIISTFEVNKTKRNGWESQWSEVSDLFLPEHNVTWSLSDIGDVSINTGAEKGYIYLTLHLLLH